MILKSNWVIAFYLAIIVCMMASNLAVANITTRIDAPALTGDDIPTAFLAGLPAVRDNGGIAPRKVRDASVVAYVVETHRGWPWRFDDQFGYRYELWNVAAGYTASLAGFPSRNGIVIGNLAVNFLGTLAVVSILHLSLFLAVRNSRLSVSRVESKSSE